jgi:Domain of unknown function (DUF3291)
VTKFQIAQVNIGRMKAPLEHEVMAGFVARLDESVEHLKNYVYRSAHAELIKQRKQWFEHFEAAYMALWWIPAGHIPGVDEAKKRLEHLDAHGPSQFAFTFRSIHQPDEAFLSSFDWSLFLPCAANT